MASALRNQVRWQLRTLVEPAFLRLYLCDETCTFRAFEDAFFALPADGERPKDEREPAWKKLKEWTIQVHNGEPADWFCAVLRGLREQLKTDDSLADLGQFWTLGALFEHPTTPKAEGHHEIHCHLRSGVPYLAMWRGYAESDRKRVALRGFECQSGNWSKRWAVLVEDVAKNLSTLPQPSNLQHDEACIGELVNYALNWSPVAPDLRKHAVRYLATCAGLSAVLTYQRGEPGLSPFDKAYQRYSKAQKIRGGPDRQNTRALVAAALHRFERDGAVAVELRPTLDRTRGETQRKLMDVVLGYFEYLAKTTAPTPLVMGLVTSLVKTEGTNPKHEPSDPAFWDWQEQLWVNEVNILLAILDEVPALRWFVVGVDAAGKERGCPLRALRRPFDEVRCYNMGRMCMRPGREMSIGVLKNLLGSNGDAIGRADRAWNALNQRQVFPVRLGVTVHAGEDFEDPLTGLRNIWEALVDLDLNEGDRVGHALAAGLAQTHVKKFFDRRSQVQGGGVKKCGPNTFYLSKPRGTHLLDLAWICQAGEPDDAHEAELRLGEVATRTFGAPTGARRLAKQLTKHGAFARAALPGARFHEPTLLDAHDRETVIIDDRWLSLTEKMRCCVIRELARRRVVVESCPTSNLVVPNLDGEPPLLALLDTQPPIRVALATDNPGLLGCYPSFEFARLDEMPPNDKVAEEKKKRLLKAGKEASFVRRCP